MQENSKKITNITAPETNEAKSVSLEAESGLIAFDFDLSVVKVSSEGQSLELSFDNGGKLSLIDFYAHLESGTLPTVQMGEGLEISMEDMLASLGDNFLDMVLAAGPQTSSPDGSGSNEYSDTAGDLVGGVDRLDGPLYSMAWDRSSFKEELFQHVTCPI